MKKDETNIGGYRCIRLSDHCGNIQRTLLESGIALNSIQRINSGMTTDKLEVLRNADRDSSHEADAVKMALKLGGFPGFPRCRTDDLFKVHGMFDELASMKDRKGWPEAFKAWDEVNAVLVFSEGEDVFSFHSTAFTHAGFSIAREYFEPEGKRTHLTDRDIVVVLSA